MRILANKCGYGFTVEGIWKFLALSPLAVPVKPSRGMLLGAVGR